jgi:UDP:flavonoid glycosyltransferase YjiC (YdhE family)
VNAALDGIFTGADRRLGLPPSGVRTERRVREVDDWPVLHGFSPLVVVPRPRDWRPGPRIAGYRWPRDPSDAALSPWLRAFLDAGEPPVFVGLGNVTVPDDRWVSEAVVTALRAAGLRGIVQRGWARVGAGDADDLLAVDEVPHALLFPHSAAVVHHAGAGTTAALRVGVPSVPVPIQFDAAVWAARLTALCVSPGPVPLRLLTVGNLGRALRAVTADPGCRRAESLGERIRAEGGTLPVLKAFDALASPRR